MSRFPTRFTLAAAALAWTFAAQAGGGEALDIELPSMATPLTAVVLTRDQVRAELATARAHGAVGDGGELGDGPKVLQARSELNAAQARELVARNTVPTRQAELAGQGLQLPAAQVPDSRIISIDAPTLFVAGSTQLSDDATQRLSEYAEAMHSAQVEVIVISIPLSPDMPAVQANLDADACARAIKAVLASRGVAEHRIYTEVRPMDSLVVGREEPVTIETVVSFV